MALVKFAADPRRNPLALAKRLPAMLLLAAIALPANAQSRGADLWLDTIAPRVSAGIEHNFEGEYEAADEVWARLQSDFPEHPAGALFAVETMFWRQLYDLFDRSHDNEIEKMGREALKIARRWFEANPDDTFAALFVGQAEIQLGRLDGMRKKYYSAGRHAERGQDYLNLALELDPASLEAKYWLGLYQYYASTLQNVLQLLSWLWFIPEPDAIGGLNALASVSESESLLSPAAQLALMNIYTYYEKNDESATELARELNARYANNTLIHFELLRILFRSGDFQSAIAEAQRLESQPLVQLHDIGRATMARVWRARSQLALGDIEGSAKTLGQINEATAVMPRWGMGWIYLLQGQIEKALGRQASATERFMSAIEIQDQSPDAARRARRELRILNPE